MTDWTLVALRAVHVTCGVYWAGGRFLTVAYPGFMIAADDDRDRLDRLLSHKRMTTSVGVAGVLTILSGTALLWLVSVGLDPAWFATTYGTVITVGAVVGVLAWMLGAAASYHAQYRGRDMREDIEAVGEMTDSHRAELSRLLGRLRYGERLKALLLLVAVLTMAVARYL